MASELTWTRIREESETRTAEDNMIKAVIRHFLKGRCIRCLKKIANPLPFSTWGVHRDDLHLFGYDSAELYDLFWDEIVNVCQKCLLSDKRPSWWEKIWLRGSSKEARLNKMAGSIQIQYIKISTVPALKPKEQRAGE